MADAVFELVGEFGEGLRVAVGNEQRVVAEPAIAMRGEGDCSFANAFRNVKNGSCGLAIATTETKRARRSGLFMLASSDRSS